MHLIFDFDGTLVDSLEKIIERFNILAEKLNLKKINHEELVGLRDLSSRELIQYLKIPIYKLPSILYKARQEISNEILMMKSFEKLPQVLQQIHQPGFSFGILTSNSRENVSKWLAINKMTHLFDFIYSEPNFFGKARLLKKILKKYNMNKMNVYYIGDETRDIDAAKQNDIHSVAVCWGFNSEQVLQKHQPNYIARTPEDLLSIFESKVK